MTLTNEIKDLEKQKFVETSDGDTAVRVQLENDDLEIGAVELKNGTDDTRATIKSDGTDNALAIFANDLDIRALTASDIVTEQNLTDIRSDNAIGISGAKYSLQSHFETSTGWVGDAAVDNLTTSVTHRGSGTKSISFDKIAGNATCVISKTISSFDMSAYSMHAIGHMHAYLSDITNVVKVFVRIGTDSSNYGQYDFLVDVLESGWNDLNIEISGNTSQTGNGYDLSAITYIAFGVEFSAAGDTLAGILTGSWAIKRVLETTQIASSDVVVNTAWVGIKDQNSNTRMDVAKGATYNYLYNRNTDGTNLMPVGDGIARPIYVSLTDGVVGPPTHNTVQADGMANTVDSFDVSSLEYYFNGTSWDRVRGDLTNGMLVNLGSNNDVVSTGDYPSGSGSNGTVTLTLASTAYSVPATASTKKHLLVVHNGSDTDVYYGFATLTSGGILLAAGGQMNVRLGANKGLFFYCGDAGKVVNYSYIEID